MGRRQVKQWLVSRNGKLIPQEQGACSVPRSQRWAGFSDGCLVHLWFWDLQLFCHLLLVWNSATCDWLRIWASPLLPSW